jgi:class 3 adenylate cyclase
MKRLWQWLENQGVDPGPAQRDAAYIQLCNQIAVGTGVWLWSGLWLEISVFPASRYLLAVDASYPLIVVLTLYFNHRRWHRAARLFLLFSVMLCIALRAAQLGNRAESPLFFLIVCVVAFCICPPSDVKSLVLTVVGSLSCMVGAEVYLSARGPLLAAPEAFYDAMRRLTIVCFGPLMVVITFLSFRGLDHIQAVLAAEHAKSESLLLNILPRSIADRLKGDRRVIADRADAATILFADIVGFTARSALMTPEDLVRLLNRVFTEFDRISRKYGLEKIKTIGDAYMVAAGIPLAVPDHCERVAAFALEVQALMSRGLALECGHLKIRMGIDTGPVVAGVIGENKFTYDVWGESVTLASRMESQGEPGKIQVTQAVAERLRGGFAFSPARQIQVKGRGALEVYFLLGPASLPL